MVKKIILVVVIVAAAVFLLGCGCDEHSEVQKIEVKK